MISISPARSRSSDPNPRPPDWTDDPFTPVVHWIGRFIFQSIGFSFAGFVLALGASPNVPKSGFEPRFGRAVLLLVTGLVVGYLLMRGVPKLRASAPFVGVLPAFWLVGALVTESRLKSFNGRSEYFYVSAGTEGIGVVFGLAICFVIGYSLGSAGHAIVRRRKRAGT